MISRSSPSASSFALHLLHKKLTYPFEYLPHVLQQGLFWRSLSQEHEILIFPSIIKREIRETQFKDGALKYFVRSLTDVRKPPHHSAGSVVQVLLPSNSDGKEADVFFSFPEDERLVAGLGNSFAKSSAQLQKVHKEDFAFSSGVRGAFWKRSDARRCGTRSSITARCNIEEPNNCTTSNDGFASETSKEVKVISAGSEKYAEVYAVCIRRKLVGNFLFHLQQKIDYLHGEAVPIVQVKLLLKRRAFLSVSPEKLLATVELLTEIFEFKSLALKVLSVNPGILEKPVEMLKQKMCILLQYEIERKTWVKIATTRGLWTLRVQNYEDNLNFLKGLGMDVRAINAMLYRSPALLSYSASSLKSTVDFLVSSGFQGSNLLKFLEVLPSILCISVDKSLAGRLKFYQDCGFSVNEIIRSLRQLPQHSWKHVESQFEILKGQGLQHEGAALIIRKQPSVLANRNEDLKAKFDFLRQVNRDVSELLTFPKYLACSLENRIIPRFKALEAVSLRQKPSLSSILAVNADVFRRRFNIPESVECT